MSYRILLSQVFVNIHLQSVAKLLIIIILAQRRLGKRFH